MRQLYKVTLVLWVLSLAFIQTASAAQFSAVQNSGESNKKLNNFVQQHVINRNLIGSFDPDYYTKNSSSLSFKNFWQQIEIPLLTKTVGDCTAVYIDKNIYKKAKTSSELYTEAQKLFKNRYYCAAAFYFKAYSEEAEARHPEKRLSSLLKEVESYFLAKDYISATDSANDIIDHAEQNEHRDKSNYYNWQPNWLPQEAKIYLHYVVIRSTYQNIQNIDGSDPTSLNYLLGRHENQLSSDYPRTLRLSVDSYISGYKNAPHTEEVKQIEIKGIEIYLRKFANIGNNTLIRARNTKIKERKEGLYRAAIARFTSLLNMLPTQYLANKPNLKIIFEKTSETLKKAKEEAGKL